MKRLALVNLTLSELPEWLRGLELDSIRLSDLPLRELSGWLFEKDQREFTLQDMDELGIPGPMGSV